MTTHQSNPFSLGDMVLATSSSYGITSDDNGYIGIVAQIIPRDQILVLNFHCLDYDSFSHLSELPAHLIPLIRDAIISGDFHPPDDEEDFASSLSSLFPSIPYHILQDYEHYVLSAYQVYDFDFIPVTPSNIDEVLTQIRQTANLRETGLNIERLFKALSVYHSGPANSFFLPPKPTIHL